MLPFLQLLMWLCTAVGVMEAEAGGRAGRSFSESDFGQWNERGSTDHRPRSTSLAFLFSLGLHYSLSLSDIFRAGLTCFPRFMSVTLGFLCRQKLDVTRGQRRVDEICTFPSHLSSPISPSPCHESHRSSEPNTSTSERGQGSHTHTGGRREEAAAPDFHPLIRNTIAVPAHALLRPLRARVGDGGGGDGFHIHRNG